LTRARDLSDIFSTTVVPTAVYDDPTSVIDPIITNVENGGNADGGEISGILDSYMYSIISQEQNNTYDGGTV
jgi:hypothetical protein